MAAKKKTVKKAKPKPLAPLAQRVGSDPALLAKALANPGLRSKLPDKYLSATQKAQRQGNLPVVPGSSLTNRAAQSQAQTNTDLYFGPNAQAKQEQQNRDVLGWYDQYKADLAQHAKNIGDINASGNAAISGLSQGIRPLADQALAEQKARESQNSAVTGSTPQDQTKTASDASAVRQAMIAALGSAEAGRGSARASQADTLANVVAPGYKLQAGAQGLQSLRDLVDKMSAYKAKQLGDITNAESASQADIAKQNLALAIATGHDTTDLAQSKISASTSKASRAQAAANARAGRAVTKRGQNLSHQDRQASVAARKAAAAKAAAKQKAAAKKAPRYGPGSLTQQQENTIAAKIDKVYGQLRSSPVKGGQITLPDGKTKIADNNSAIISALMSAGLTRDEAHVALSLYRNKGTIGPDGAKSAANAGLRKGRYKRATPQSRLGSSAIDKLVQSVTGAVK